MYDKKIPGEIVLISTILHWEIDIIVKFHDPEDWWILRLKQF